MGDEYFLPLEVLIKIFEYVQPNKKDKTRLAILRTGSNIRNICLLQVWTPWSNQARGLRFSVIHGHVGYFRRWRKLMPKNTIEWLGCADTGLSLTVTASEHGHLDLVKMFTRDPLSIPGGILDPSKHNWIAFRRACAMKHRNVARYFLNHLDVPKEPIEDAFIFSCKNGHDEIVKILLDETKLDPSNFNSYCLKKACKHGHLKVVELLLDDGRADPNIGWGLCLYYAYDRNYIEIYKALALDWRIKIPRWMRKNNFVMWKKENEIDDSSDSDETTEYENLNDYQDVDSNDANLEEENSSLDISSSSNEYLSNTEYDDLYDSSE